jgi:formate/nitrite transporter FocA (FNT family)
MYTYAFALPCRRHRIQQRRRAKRSRKRAVWTHERQEAQERSSVTVQVIHEAIRKQGDEELNRPAQALAWSGLAAGFSMGMSLVVEGLLQTHLPDTPWRPLVVRLGYPFGFLMVVGGRQQ